MLKKSPETKRVSEIDVIRSLCFIWIVAIWHMNSYLSPSLKYTGGLLLVFHNVTYAALGMFTFLSGVLLSKYQFGTFRDIQAFYKKRLSRFFILLCFSTLTYRLVGWITTEQVVQVLFGVNLLIGPAVPTLWFFSMMVFYYLITPLLKNHFIKKETSYMYIGLLFSMIIFAGLYVCFKCFGSDKRLLFYYPMFVLGLYVGVEKLVWFIHSKWLLYLTPVIALIFVGGLNPIVAEVAGGFLFILCGRLAFPAINSFWWFISTSSMIAYLFHRQFFSLIVRVFEHVGIPYIPFGYAVIAFILLVIICFYFQSVIDSLNKKRV